jgi:O-antigen/teichoic acid export membrane protein
MGSAQIIGFVAQFTASVVLARYLTPHEFGIFAAGMATVAILSLLQNLGLQSFIVKEKDLTQDVLKSTFTINAILCVGVSLLTALVAFLGARFLQERGVQDVILVLAITPLFGIFSFLPAANIEREGRFRDISLVTMLLNIGNAGLTILFAVLGFKYMSLAYAGVISAGLMSLAYIALGRRHFALRVGLADWKRIADFGFQLLMGSSIVTIAHRVSELSLGKISGLASLGLYNRASGLNNMPWGHIYWLASRIVLVDFANLHREGLPLRDRYLQTLAIITALLIPAFAGLGILAKPVLFYVYGERWLPAALPLTLLAIASMVLVTITLTSEVLTVTGKVRIQTRVEAMRAPISTTLFIGACFISIEAAAFSRIVDAVIAVALYRPHMSRLTSTRFRDLRPLYMQSTLLTTAATLPALLAVLWADQGIPTVPEMVGAVSLGGALWLATLFVMKHPLATEIRISIQHRWPKAIA